MPAADWKAREAYDANFRRCWRASVDHARPPLKLKLSEWMEANVRLPEGVSALPGRVRLWPYQRDIADAISAPEIERITLVKPVRVGFTTLLTGTIGSYVANEPAPILVLLPTEADCRDYVVSDIEPIFDATPALKGLLRLEDNEGERNTLLSRRFPGGSLKIVASRAPRNLRRHTARILICDEADAMEATAEGNPIRLGERRTLTFANRKIIIGSTPIFSDTSAVLAAYEASDRRIYEVPCPICGAFFEIQWAHIVWPKDLDEKGVATNERTEDAYCECPHCKERIEERFKTHMVHAGVWRVTRPEVQRHAGFRLNSLISLLSNASWAKLAAEFIAAKNDPGELQVFVNTVLAQGWSTPAMINEGALASRAEDWDINRIPVEVLVLTAGADVQNDRVEISVLGWTRTSECLVLAHFVIWGVYSDQSTWDEVDELLRTKWRHPFGGMLKIDACCIDAGDGEHFDHVLNFCLPKMPRRIFASKGMSGARPGFAMSKGKRMENKLALLGVDTLKNLIFDKLQRGRGIRFSNSLEPVYYEQLASERRVLRYNNGRPKLRFEPTSGRARNEALDCLTYATAVRSAVNIPFDRRELELREGPQPRRSVADLLAH